MAEIYGRNPVLESLRHGGGVSKVLIARGAHETLPVQEIMQLAQANGVPIELTERSVLDMRTSNGVHQGVIAIIKEYNYATVDDIIARAKGEPMLVLALDSVQDPQNLGTLLRSAEAIGVHGVILPERRAVQVTPIVEKASAGAARLLAIAQITNLVRTLNDMKKAGAWVVGVENEPSAPTYDHADLTGPMVLVLGSEGRGLGRLVRETCDSLVRLPMRGKVSSLNVAVAGSVILYEVLRQRALAAEGAAAKKKQPTS
jgi:23S rRNA (guanosine2251-2'-O)-methyltransferase